MSISKLLAKSWLRFMRGAMATRDWR